MSVLSGLLLTPTFTFVTGDYFDLQVFKSPAFNSTFPTRSIAFLYTTVYVPYTLTHRFLTCLHPTVKELIPSPQALILVPRIVHVLLSFIVDYVLIRFCSLHRKKERKVPIEEDMDLDSEVKDEDSFQLYSTRLITLASSQVILVFVTRTHSALINLILFGILLSLVSDSIHRMGEYLPVLIEFHSVDAKEKVREKVSLLKELRALRYNPIENLHWIAVVVICGVFNDPEFFLSYACVPIFFYFQRGISNQHIGMSHFHIRLFVFLVYFFIFSVPFILWDSFYHKRVTLRDFNELNLGFSSFVIAPVNHFITKASSIRNWETIPWIFIAYIFLFNVLGFLGLLSISKELYDAFFKDWKLKPRIDSQWMFLNCSWFLPLILLIQYKSPFDLVPLLFPLVVMHGHKIPLISRFSWKLGVAWFSCNLAGVIFWGYLNQGGILSSFLDLNAQLLPHRFKETHVDILIAQMDAIPPTFALTIPSKWKTIIKSQHILPDLDTSSYDKYVQALPKTVLKLELESKVRVFHMGDSSRPLCHFENEMLRILHRKNPESPKVNFILIPSTPQMKERGLECFQKSRLTLVKTYWNHFHLQWPILNENIREDFQNSKNWTDSHLPSIRFGLNLYRFEDLRYSSPEPKFETLFLFTNDSFLSYSIQCALLVFTGFIFVASFLAYVD